MIPHIIHYCWFGGNPLPRSAKKCIASWKKFFPNWEIREWNETNFNVHCHPYASKAYQEKHWAYLSDIVRLIVVEEYGGIYFDTDVEVIRYPEDLLNSCTAWFGFEYPEYVATGLGFAATPHHPAVVAMLQQYNNLTIITGCPQLNTEALVPFGLIKNGLRQTVCEAEILPREWLCPFDDLTGRMNKTSNTVSIHWYSKSPHGKWALYKAKLTRLVHRYFGVNIRKKLFS